MSAVWMKRVFFWIQKTSKAHISLLDIKVHTVQYWWEIMELLRCGILSGIAKIHMLNIRTSLFTTMTNVVYYNVMKTDWEKPIDQSILFNRFKVELTFSLCKLVPYLYSPLWLSVSAFSQHPGEIPDSSGLISISDGHQETPIEYLQGPWICQFSPHYYSTPGTW